MTLKTKEKETNGRLGEAEPTNGRYPNNQGKKQGASRIRRKERKKETEKGMKRGKTRQPSYRKIWRTKRGGVCNQRTRKEDRRRWGGKASLPAKEKAKRARGTTGASSRFGTGKKEGGFSGLGGLGRALTKI